METTTGLKAFFRDIFEYHHHFNQRLGEQLVGHVGHLNDRMVPMFSHIVNAHQIWNARIRGKKTLGVHDVHNLEKCMALDTGNYKDTMQVLDRFEMPHGVAYSNSKGMEFHNTVQEILFHIANHTTHHRAQIISDLRQQGIAPVATDYIFYKR